MPIAEVPPPLDVPPSALVSDGRLAFGSYSAPVQSVNLLDRWSGPARRLHALRLKEWQAFQLSNDEHFVLGAVYDTKSLGLLQVVVVEKSTGRVRRFEHKVPTWALSVAQGLSGTRSSGRWHGLVVTVTNDVGSGSVEVVATAAARGSRPALDLTVTGDCTPGRAGTIVICHPFPDDTPLYSTKVAMPAQGTLTVGRRTETFRADRSVLVLDDHKGHYPYPMAYDWLTGARVLPDGRRVVLNLTGNQVRDPETYNENVVVVDADVHRLPPVRFERRSGVAGPWRVGDSHGMVDVTFVPDVPNEQHVGPRRVLAEYDGPFGWLSGRVETATGPLSLDGFYGMGERKIIRV